MRYASSVRWCSRFLGVVAAALLVGIAIPQSRAETDPLPSWNDGAAKQSIISFVGRVTKDGGVDFVPEAQRVAVFDNDGTLWAEQPNYVQAFFIFDRVKAMGKSDPELLARQPFKAVAEGDMKALAQQGEHGLAQLVAATHSGMTVDAFEKIAKDWLVTAKNPKLDRRCVELVYQPQIELLAFLRANGFKTFIVTGGGVEFVRAFSEKAYDVPPERVVGSSGKTRYEIHGDDAVLIKLPEIGSVDDGPGKPININLHIGQRPILAFGNSDGDQQMLEYTASGDGARLMLLVHHDDSAREWAYDRTSHIGKLDKALDEANARHWTVVSMKNDWKTIFAPQK